MMRRTMKRRRGTIANYQHDKSSGQDSYEGDYGEEEDYYPEHEDYEAPGDYDEADYGWELKDYDLQ